ncbi:MAG: S8 family serine peptidase [Cytophagaceae bacterium]|nr:S8 family serine peptidase [Cytophagaceae bacterium]
MEQRERIKQNLKSLGGDFQEKTPFLYKVTLNAEQEAKLFSVIQREANNLCVSSMLMYADSTVQWTSNEIILKIFSDANIETVLNDNSISYKSIRQLGYDLQVFVVTLTGIEDKTIEYANLLYESGNIVFAQPSFWRLIKLYNPLYPQQWGFNNTGQNGGMAGIDINAPEAWQLSTGTGVKVAVIDEGVDLTHSDLNNNLLFGYDATDGSLGGSNGSSKGNDAHGTACAGIIAAEDNSEGVKGVAYNAKIIPVRIAYKNSYNNWVTYDTWITDGVYNAWYHKNADVLSNSWGGGSNSPAINNEINAAITQGRGGKGCVVVFASGNNYASSVSYPASLPNVLAVGAINRNGNKADFSNYGTALDIVAPGVDIPTTDIRGNGGYNYVTNNQYDPAYSDYANKDYTGKFGGTSAACPHVAGVAALVLSYNPDLTAQQVRNIIENTAQKVRADLYTYSNNAAHPNGTWNNQVGHGLVNAYAAIQAACPTLVNFTNQTVTTNTTVKSCGDINIENVTVKNGAKLTLDAPGEVNIGNNFEVEEDGEFEIIEN